MRIILRQCTVATSVSRAPPPLCLYFARGRCARGERCTRLHRAPTTADERHLGAAVDVFGRERFGTEREDMGGVGSFLSDSRTLYVGGLGSYASGGKGAGGGDGCLEELVRANFAAWGPIEYCRVKRDKGCAFVRYAWRSTAEFAKQAMANQVLLRDPDREGGAEGSGAAAAQPGPQRPAAGARSAAG